MSRKRHTAEQIIPKLRAEMIDISNHHAKETGVILPPCGSLSFQMNLHDSRRFQLRRHPWGGDSKGMDNSRNHATRFSTRQTSCRCRAGSPETRSPQRRPLRGLSSNGSAADQRILRFHRLSCSGFGSAPAASHKRLVILDTRATRAGGGNMTPVSACSRGTFAGTGEAPDLSVDI